jgi:RNA polymerase sigma-70 factor (ECF subfamily)
VAAIGERAASEQALERHRGKIERHIRSLVRDRALAEDLTQETLVRAHQQLVTLRDPGALGPWLYRIATHVCTDHLRRAAVSLETCGSESAERIAGAGRTADELADDAAMSACGEKLLDRLPDAYRAVLLLHDMQGLTSVEIARLTRSTPGSVKIRLHRARQRFREALESECQIYRDSRGVLLGCPRPRRP